MPEPGPGQVEVRALVNPGRSPLDRLVTGTYGQAQAADALTAGRTDASAVKAVVRPWE